MSGDTTKAEIESAIDNNQFCLHYQAVTDLQTGGIIEMEALIRWMHPERGLISAQEFIGAAEDPSIANKLGNWVIREICLNIRDWIKKDISVPRVAMNVSPQQLQNYAFTQNLFNTMKEFAIDPSSITLEITEQLLINHSDDIDVILGKIKTQGLQLSLDDFGTGYSALSYLKQYPFDYVKIDRSFIRDITVNPSDAAITNAVISMAHNMGIKVIAEGVENEAQCEYLSKNMCDFVQGYLISKPLSAQDAGEFILSKYTLPENLRRFTPPNRTLLIVDDEEGIVASLKRLFRQDGYQIFTAYSAADGLEILKTQPISVIISDQRMPAMTGVEFLRQAKKLYPDTIRIVLSGYTELRSITEAINEGAIYKFFTKPWDDQQLREQILDAFKQKELIDENHRLGLEVRTANQELAMVNRQLAVVLQRKERQLDIGETSLEIAREALQHIPIPMVGIDDDGMIAFVNMAAGKLFGEKVMLLGENIDALLSDFSSTSSLIDEGTSFSLNIPNFDYVANLRTMDTRSKSRGKIVTFFKKDGGI